MLLTKLNIPRPASDLVKRTALFEKLDSGLNKKLSLVSAPAGFGKSTIISDWIKQKELKAGWYSLDKGDNGIAGFLAYVAMSIKKVYGQKEMKLLELINSPSPPEPSVVLDMIINEICLIEEDVLLVLDDFHVITDKHVVDAIEYLIEYMPDNMHLVLITRSDPNLPIPKLRSQNQLVEIRSADLSFSANEISQLFNKKIKTKLSTEDVLALESKTEGWIAGLQLAALSLDNYEDSHAFVKAFTGNNRYIMDYLIEEVLKSLSEDIRIFMLKISILEQFSAPLCNHMLGCADSHIKLDYLESKNMFVVPLDAERCWFRFHHLFADLLKQRLMLEYKDDLDEIHNKASDWFAENKMYEYALNHAFEIMNYQKCMDLLSNSVEELWENGNHGLILQYGDLLPDELIKQYPEFCLYYAWIQILGGSLKNAESFLESAEKTNAETNASPEQLQGRIAATHAYLHAELGDVDKAVEQCKRAFTLLPEEDELWSSFALFAEGVYYFRKGDILGSKDSFEKALYLSKKSGNMFLISSIAIRMAENEQILGNNTTAYNRCKELIEFIDEKGFHGLTVAEPAYAALYHIMGGTEYMWGNSEKGMVHIKKAYELSLKANDIYLRTLILMVYTFILYDVGDSSFAEYEKKVDELIEGRDLPDFLHSLYLGWKMYMYTEQDQIDKAYEFIEHSKIDITGNIDVATEQSFVAYARLLIIAKRYDDAKELVERLHKEASENGRIERLIEINIIYAMLCEQLGDNEKGLSLLIECLAIASKEQMISGFVVNSRFLMKLLKQVEKMDLSKDNISKSFIKKIMSAIEKRNTRKQSEQNDILSARELDTLKQIATGLSNQQVAETLFISLNTVKTHVKNILLKLEVTNRNDAVAKAKEMGVL